MAVRPTTSYAATAALITVLLTAGCALPVASGQDPLPSAAATSVPAPSSSTSTTTATPTTATPTPSTPKATPKPKSTPAEPAALLSKGDSGPKVRELQHRLRQLEWFAGSITGRYRTSTVKAVKGFQDKRELDTTGAVDKATWASLVSRTRKPTDDELHNRLTPGRALMRQGTTGNRVRELQARLKQIGWFSGSVTGTYGSVTVAGVRGFQGKRAIPVTGEVDQRTWDRLTAMTREPTSDALHNRTPKPSASGLDSRCLTGRALCVSKSSNTLTWVIDGQPQLRTDVRFGSAELPTREGAFAVGWKSRDHVSTIYHTPMPYAMFFSGGQAVHYSPDFAARGYNGASHGCVNVRSMSAIQTLFAQVRVGDKVIVYR
ncbi:peptidoglycan-binding protein [uncultured Friedmanniella sp.]|uniref:L,D-transpeptidase family protein n=1 Tax=uncultured Friedmanniella sp. TaxID=335381 RepID=UPI0035CA07F2